VIANALRYCMLFLNSRPPRTTRRIMANRLKAGLRDFANIAGLVVGVVGLYLVFSLDNRGEVEIDVVENIALFPQWIPDPAAGKTLDILWDGQSLLNSGNVVRYIVIDVKNVGRGDIKSEDFDKNIPLEVMVGNGEVLYMESWGQSLGYTDTEAVNFGPQGGVQIKHARIDAGESYAFMLFVLINGDSIPKFSTVGRIGGVKRISLKESYRDIGRPPFHKSVFSGGALVQLVRT
jgi:hypothetical protein